MPALTMLGIVVGIVVFVILVVSVAQFWVAAIIGLGVILVLSLVDGFGHYKRAGTGALS